MNYVIFKTIIFHSINIKNWISYVSIIKSCFSNDTFAFISKLDIFSSWDIITIIIVVAGIFSKTTVIIIIIITSAITTTVTIAVFLN